MSAAASAMERLQAASPDGKTGRVAHIDVARGLSIVLVALYHSGLQPWMPELMQALGLCRLPLFFFLAGVVFPVRRSVMRVAAGRARALLQPYALVLLLLLGRSLLKGEGADPWAGLLGIAWGNGGTIEWVPMWFLPHLWWVSLAAAVWVQGLGWCRWPVWLRGLSLLVLLAGATVMIQPERHVSFMLGTRPWDLPWWPFSADLTCLSLFFVLLGLGLQRHVRSFEPHVGWGLAAAGVFGVLAVGSDALLNFHLRQLEAPVFVVCAALAGVYGLLSLSWWMARWPLLCALWRHLGQASLFILIFHDHVDNKVQQSLMPTLGQTHPLGVALLAFGLCLVVPWLIRQVVLRVPVLSMAFGLRVPVVGRPRASAASDAGRPSALHPS